MLKRTDQKKHLKKRLEDASSHLEAFVKNQHAEELHHLRVNLKKVKALVFLSDAGTKKSKIKKRFEPAKIIFKHAGNARTSMLYIKMLREHGIKDEALDKQVNAALKRNTDLLLKYATTYIHRLKTTENRMRDHVYDMDKDLVEGIFKKQIKKLGKVYAAVDPNEEFHNTRKMIKHLVYIHDMLPKSMQAKIPLHIHYLKQLEGSLGRWHDDILAIEFLKKGKPHPRTIVTLQKSVTKMEKSVKTLTRNFEKRVWK